MSGFRTGWNLPPGVTDRMIDEAAGGYDEPPFDGEEEPEEEEGPMEGLVNDTLALARAYRAEAKKQDEAWLKQADPRAVQGGDHSAEAETLRKLARDLILMAKGIEEL